MVQPDLFGDTKTTVSPADGGVPQQSESLEGQKTLFNEDKNPSETVSLATAQGADASPEPSSLGLESEARTKSDKEAAQEPTPQTVASDSPIEAASTPGALCTKVGRTPTRLTPRQRQKTTESPADAAVPQQSESLEGQGDLFSKDDQTKNETVSFSDQRDAFQATIVRKGVADAPNGDTIKIIPDPVLNGRYVLEVVTPEGSRSVVGDTAASIETAQEQALEAARLNPEFRPKSSQTETVSDPEPSPKDATVSSKPEEDREPTDEELDAAMDAELDRLEKEEAAIKPVKPKAKPRKSRSKTGKETHPPLRTPTRKSRIYWISSRHEWMHEDSLLMKMAALTQKH